MSFTGCECRRQHRRFSPELTAALHSRPPAKEIPSEHPPHVTEHPEAVLAVVRRLVDEELLVTLYPLVGVRLAEMPVSRTQLTDEVVRVKELITFGILLYCGHKCGVNVVTAGHDLHSFYCFYIQ